jgi:MFS family permease
LSWRIAALCVMAFGCYLAEGAATNWSAVYLRNNLGAAASIAAVAYAAFSTAMTAGRLAGDHLADRFGPVRLIRSVGSVAAAGFALALVIATPVAAVIGFLVIGFGLSFVVPLVFTASSAQGRAGPTLALVSSCGYMGMLVGPAIIGGAAELIGLPTALGLMAILCGLAAVLAPAVTTTNRMTARDAAPTNDQMPAT